MAEFTGERVIPGLVDANLFNEHLARYRFADRFIGANARVLDAGCGSGYGAAEVSEKALVIAADISAEAIRYAREQFPNERLKFLQAACEALPFADDVFDLVTSFEVIEHLQRWPELLRQANRVLRPSGVLLVSTPNKAYYAESRAEAGPNPFHCHEFEYDEFRLALEAVFPYVRIWTQNHSEAIVFAPHEPAQATLDATGDDDPEYAHFFVAACSQSPILMDEVFAWVPASANVLREREHHITKLEGELEKKDGWLTDLKERHERLHLEHESTVAELTQRNEWAEGLNRELLKGRAQIDKLQAESEERLAWLRRIEEQAGKDRQESLGWVADLEAQVASGQTEIGRLNNDVTAMREWGESLNSKYHEKALEVQQLWQEVQQLRGATERLEQASRDLAALRDERRLVASSKWFRLGRKLNIGPVVGGDGE